MLRGSDPDLTAANELEATAFSACSAARISARARPRFSKSASPRSSGVEGAGGDSVTRAAEARWPRACAGRCSRLRQLPREAVHSVRRRLVDAASGSASATPETSAAAPEPPKFAARPAEAAPLGATRLHFGARALSAGRSRLRARPFRRLRRRRTTEALAWTVACPLGRCPAAEAGRALVVPGEGARPRLRAARVHSDGPASPDDGAHADRPPHRHARHSRDVQGRARRAHRYSVAVSHHFRSAR